MSATVRPHPIPDSASGRGAPFAVPVRLLAPWLCFALTRVLLVLAVLGVLRLGMDVTSDVKVIYQGWAAVLRTGTFPLDDVTWQYPPLAALVIIAPGWLPWTYFTSFLVLLGVCDTAAMALLHRAADRGGSTAGPWLWAAAVPLLGPTVYTRFDLVVTVLAMAALVLLARRPRVAGVLIGLGTMIKVWPVVLLVAARRLRVFTGAVVSASVVGFGFAVFTVGAYSFVGFQGSRGIEVESVAAVPCYFAALVLGWPGHTQMHYGSLEFLGPGIPVLAGLMPLLTLAGLGWLLWWRRRARGRFLAADAALTALLLFTVTSRVLSPQYLVWLLGIAALCLCSPRTTQRPVALLLVPATVLTLLEFPLFFGELSGVTWWGAVLITARNGLLVAATLLSCRRLSADVRTAD